RSCCLRSESFTLLPLYDASVLSLYSFCCRVPSPLLHGSATQLVVLLSLARPPRYTLSPCSHGAAPVPRPEHSVNLAAPACGTGSPAVSQSIEEPVREWRLSSKMM